LKIATIALAAIALGAVVLGFAQYNGVRTLKAQLAAATAAATRADAEAVTLRSQLAAAQERINSQGSKLTAAQQQASTEEQRLDVVQQQAAAEKQQLAAAKQRVDQEQHALEQQKRELIAAESLPELPVRLVFFNAARVGAKVAFLQNLSDSALNVTLDVLSPGSNTHVHKEIALSAHGSLRMGPSQGYVLTPGQVITLNNAKFRRIVRMVT